VAEKIAFSIGDACVLRLASPDGQRLDPVAFSHPDERGRQILSDILHSMPQLLDERASMKVFQSGEAELIPEGVAAPLQQNGQPSFQDDDKRVGLGSLLIVPLRVVSGVIGSLALSRDQGRPPYSTDDLVLIQSLADQASLAIVNARLYQDLEIALSQEQSTREQLILFEKHAAISRMTASVAHELHNPIQTINNCLYLTRLDNPPDSPVQEYLNMAFAETERISRLVAQLREIYRPGPHAELKPLDLLPVLARVHSILEPHLQHEHVIWEQSLECKGAIVNGVDDKIMQVFLNISLNAIEAMQPGGGTLAVKISVPPGSEQVQVNFIDTGPGIAHEDISRLFEPFFTTKESGTGLGLSISDDIIRGHGGLIMVESQVGAGAKFTVSLPLAPEHNGEG
jgi:signal transduction histidine kinase